MSSLRIKCLICGRDMVENTDRTWGCRPRSNPLMNKCPTHIEIRYEVMKI